MNMTTTEKNWLAQFTTTTKAVCMDILRLHKRDYDGWEPDEVAQMREMNKKIHEHDNLLTDFFKQLTVSLSPLIKFDERTKNKRK